MITLIGCQYKTLGTFKNVKIILPSIIGLLHKKPHHIVNENSELVYIADHYNLSNSRQNNGIHTIAKNIYVQDGSVKDKVKCPLGREVIASVEVIIKYHADQKTKSIIINIHIYTNQNRTAEYVYNEFSESKIIPNNAKTFFVPRDKTKIVFIPA